MNRPEEPMGIGAVVQTADGRLCVRALHEDYPWICESHSGGWRNYDEIEDVIIVLSQGVHRSAYSEDDAMHSDDSLPVDSYPSLADW